MHTEECVRQLTATLQIQAAVAAVSALVSTAVAVTPMAVRGADFVNSVDGSRFQIIGVA